MIAGRMSELRTKVQDDPVHGWSPPQDQRVNQERPPPSQLDRIIHTQASNFYLRAAARVQPPEFIRVSGGLVVEG
jgi:hypothetical protein